MTDRQQTYWVIGYGTTVGKSAVAESLLALLLEDVGNIDAGAILYLLIGIDEVPARPGRNLHHVTTPCPRFHRIRPSAFRPSTVPPAAAAPPPAAGSPGCSFIKIAFMPM